MFRVAAGELPETLRIAHPGTTVAFAKRDAVTDGYEEAVRAAREHGFEATLRLAGGRAAVFHDGTMEIGHAIPDEEPRAGIDARVGEVAGEYCPGRYSVNARGAAKLAGIGQRVVGGGSHTGVVLVVEGEDRINAVLEPVYAALGLAWDPSASGSVRTEAPSAGWDAVRDAIVTEYAREYDLVEDSVDPETLNLAESLAGEHRVG